MSSLKESDEKEIIEKMLTQHLPVISSAVNERTSRAQAILSGATISHHRCYTLALRLLKYRAFQRASGHSAR